MADGLLSDLERYGALRPQLVDLAEDRSSRTLPYLDLARTPISSRPPVVFEAQGQARAYVFDGRSDSTQDVSPWIRRIAFRGDADWIGVLRPGRLEIYRAALGLPAAPQPVRVSSQEFLFPELMHRQLRPAPSVRGALLALLRQSISQAIEADVDPRDALSIVGRAVFWRFLLDRQLLQGIDPADIAPGATSPESCLDSKGRALATFRWLERTFNGSLLSFTTAKAPAEISASVYERVVGNIAHGATAEGQLELRLPSEWRQVNFAHVPVGLLSEVYEAFAHAQDKDEATTASVFYTPRHVAELVVDEALAALGDVSEPRVLDPSAGAGVFLVAAFRALVAREWDRTGAHPSRKTVRRILNRQLTGFDISDDALRLAELALYLTAIELDPEQHPRPLALLRFDAVRDRVLFLKSGGPGRGSLGPVEKQFRNRFDLVVGNPPWTAKADVRAKRTWVVDSGARLAELLGEERAARFDFPDTNPDLPFVYRATEWAKLGAVIALVTHARWLFSQSERGRRAREDLLEAVTVTGLLNGTALRETSVWPNVRHPFCLLFARNQRPAPGAAVQFVSPELDRTPDREQEHFRIDWKDASDIAIEEILAHPFVLKARFRGTSIDESILADAARRGIPLGDFLRQLGTALRNGYQVGGTARKQVSASELVGLPDLKGLDPGFVVDTSALPRFSRRTPLYPRKRAIYVAPLLLIHESMRVEADAPRAVVALDDVAFDERFDGVSFRGVADGTAIASYLQLVIQSSYFAHSLLFLDGQYGVEREVVHKTTIERIAIVPWSALSPAHKSAAGQLARRLGSATHPTPLFHEIDTFVADTLHLSDVQRQAIADTLSTALPTAAAKRESTRATRPEDRSRFAMTLDSELRELLDQPILVTEDSDLGGAPWRFLLVSAGTGTARDIHLRRADRMAILDAADGGAASLVTVHLAPRTMMIGLLDQYRYWTPTRARLLAAELASELADE